MVENELRNHGAEDWYDTVMRYQTVNDRIDARLIQKGRKREAFIHGGEFATLYLHPEFEEKWKGSLYDRKRYVLSTEFPDALSLAHYSNLTKGQYNGQGMSEEYKTESTIMGYCDYVIGSEDGPIIHLEDPYGEVTLPSFYGMPSSLSLMYSGKLLLVTAEFLPGEEPYILEVKVVGFPSSK